MQTLRGGKIKRAESTGKFQRREKGLVVQSSLFLVQGLLGFRFFALLRMTSWVGVLLDEEVENVVQNCEDDSQDVFCFSFHNCYFLRVNTWWRFLDGFLRQEMWSQ